MSIEDWSWNVSTDEEEEGPGDGSEYVVVLRCQKDEDQSIAANLIFPSLEIAVHWYGKHPSGGLEWYPQIPTASPLVMPTLLLARQGFPKAPLPIASLEPVDETFWFQLAGEVLPPLISGGLHIPVFPTLPDKMPRSPWWPPPLPPNV